MTLLNPSNTSVNDICTEALRECGAIGVGQSPSAADLVGAQARLQWMLQTWERKSLLVYHLVTAGVVCNGGQTYTIGPGGQFDTNIPWMPFSAAFGAGGLLPANNPFGPTYPVSARPSKIESSFVRQLVNSQPNQIDYPMRLIQTMNDYNRIALKQLSTFPGYLFYDPAWPLGLLYPWPVPQPEIYALFVTVVEQLPPMFATAGAVFSLPFEYYSAMYLNLALLLRPKYSIPTFPGDMLPGLAKDALATLRKSNTRITQLQMPADLLTGKQYNIFSDQFTGT